MKKGIFWIIDGKPMTVSVECDAVGETVGPPPDYSSKSGDNFNHRIEWGKLPRRITGGAAYNCYPRGRVEIRNGRATVWLNPVLNTPATVKTVKKEFDLHDGEIKIEIKNDNSKHYEYKNRKEEDSK